MRKIARNPYIALYALLALFVLRVLGQLLVLVAAPPFLPPMDEWFSGLMPYPYLLISQVLIILLMTKMCRDVHRGTGLFGVKKAGLGEFLMTFGLVYLGVMLIRYGIRMSLYPLERWTGGSIPIFFHWVLSSFVILLGRYHAHGTKRPPPAIRARAWRAAVYLALSIGVGAWACFQLAPTILARCIEARSPQYAVRIEHATGFATSGGVKLVADIFHPQRLTKSPTVLVRVPFSKTFLNRLFANVVGRFWAERGYTAVIQGTRGRYESEGNYEPLVHEENDGKETLAWLKGQPWFNQRLGMWGGSYFGYTQLVLADATNPEISAMMVQIASADFSKMFYTNGAFALESALQWGLGSYGKTDSYPDATTMSAAIATVPLISADERAVGVQIPFLRDWMREPPGSDFWRQLDATPKLKSLHGPVLSMAGWFDPFLPAQLDDFRRIQETTNQTVGQNSRLIIGPWAHARSVQLPDGFIPRNYRLESLAPSIPWFDQFLLGKAPGDGAPKVRIFVMGRNEWRNEREWPLKRAVETDLCLSPLQRNRTGALLTEASAPPGKDTFRYDPTNPLATVGGAMIGPNAGSFRQPDRLHRPDVLTYETKALEQETEVTGYPVVNLNASSTASSTDFTARLLDVFPDGSSFNISDGIVRTDLRPEQPQQIRIELWPTSYLFKAGHKIRLEVSSSNFPRFDRHFNISRFNRESREVQAAEQTVFYGGSTPSILRLPIVRAPAD